ncbi:multicopper oxidase [Peniophora sp. CONT]|nr:multicopper oxidase [Peniophora sp. CONT]
MQSAEVDKTSIALDTYLHTTAPALGLWGCVISAQALKSHRAAEAESHLLQLRHVRAAPVKAHQSNLPVSTHASVSAKNATRMNLGLVLSARTLARTVSKTLDIGNGIAGPDGFYRSAVLTNGLTPGPIISGNKGDSFVIEVVNRLVDTRMDVVTSVHWHGIDQLHSNWADGVDSVTQCPIIPGHSFQYKFNVKEQAGTFWYHSHYANQYCEALRGVFVVYDPRDPHAALYDVDDESTVLTLSDWYHYFSHEQPVIPAPNSSLINGLGRYPGGPDTPLAVVHVRHGVRYRFRLVNMACDPNFIFSIDSHELTIIEVDGTNVQPLTVTQIQIFVGQRYSFVLQANKRVDNYWIRALPDFNPPADFTDGKNSAILRYFGAKITHPTTSNAGAGSHPLKESDLRPLVPTPPPSKADHTIVLNVDINQAGDRFLVNGQTFSSPDPVPVLLQILSGASHAKDLLPAGSVYDLKPNQTVDLVVPGGVVGGPHPMHLHGHSFWVIQSAGERTQNIIDPVLRDVVSIGDVGDNVTIRFRTENPGPWYFHCHIDWHLTDGFGVVMAEDALGVSESEKPPPEWDQLCPLYADFTNSDIYP